VSGMDYRKILQDMTLKESAEDTENFGKPSTQEYPIKTGELPIDSVEYAHGSTFVGEPRGMQVVPLVLRYSI
jgi:hypothetical protein